MRPIPTSAIVEEAIRCLEHEPQENSDAQVLQRHPIGCRCCLLHIFFDELYREVDGEVAEVTVVPETDGGLGGAKTSNIKARNVKSS